MTWPDPDARTELRTLISDGDQDKFGYLKQVLNEQNGTNTIFKTVDSRRVTDFTSADAPMGVYVNNNRVSPSDVVEDFTTEGQFELRSAPNNGDTVRATYYFRWFLDDEIDTFLQDGTKWCLSVSDKNAVPDGLKPAVLHFSASEAYQKLAIRWARRLSEEYRTEDATDEERFKIIDAYNKAAESERRIAQVFRQNYYERNDQARAPLFASIAGSVRRVQPRR